MARKRVVVIGGGTGNYTVLKGLKEHDLALTAIVSMADDGGSTGILRDELGVLPPGDVRQCLVALSNSSDLLRSVMDYRFERGRLGGHSLGNLLLSALEKVTGSFERAVEEVGRILYIQGQVIPVTTHHVRLKMLLKDHTLLEGEKEVYLSQAIDQGYTSIFLEPRPTANPHAVEAIEKADLVVVGPGGLYTSLIPNFLVDGIGDALARTKAKKVYVANLMNRKGQTSGFTLQRYIDELSRFIGTDPFDYILTNSQKPDEALIDQYAEEGELLQNDMRDPRVIEAPLLGDIAEKARADTMARNLIRHSSTNLSQELYSLVTRL